MPSLPQWLRFVGHPTLVTLFDDHSSVLPLRCLITITELIPFVTRCCAVTVYPPDTVTVARYYRCLTILLLFTLPFPQFALFHLTH